MKSLRMMATFGGVVTALATMAYAGSHTWRINEIYSTADGSIQFIELIETCGGSGETALSGHTVKSNSHTVNLNNLAPNSSSNKKLLFGTANLTMYGGPAPDYIIPANFFSLTGDTLQYTPYHTCNVASGSVPTNGTNSLNRTAGCATATCPANVAVNSPTNFAGIPGTITPPVCTDGDGDGYGSPGDASCPNGSQTDCNDAAPAIHPGATENCSDTIDNDCNGDTDCNDAACASGPPCIPTMSQWGLGIVALVVLAGGSAIARKRLLI